MNPGKPNERFKYELAFRECVMREVADFDSVQKVAEHFGIPINMLHNWVKADDVGQLGHSLRMNSGELNYLTQCLFSATKVMESSELQSTCFKVSRSMPDAIWIWSKSLGLIDLLRRSFDR